MAAIRLERVVKFALASLLISFPVIAFSAQERIGGPIENGRTMLLKGRVHPHARAANDRGALNASTQVHDLRLVITPSAEQSAALEQLVEEQRDPSSPNYQKWLSPEEYGERFGLNDNDLAKLTSWLESQGFSIGSVARAKNWIRFDGTAGQVKRTFRTELHRYEVEGETHFANASEASLPASLAGVVSDIRGLDDFRPKPQSLNRLRPMFNAGASSHYLAPDDFATIYDIASLYQAGFDGTGQKLVIAGQTDISLSDLRSFRSTFKLPAKDPQVVLQGTDPGVRQGDNVEALLDIEWAGAIARNATIIYVNSQNVFESVQYALDQNLAPVISLSYGACELGIPASYRNMALQANAEGITWMSASGDSGAAGCDAQGASGASSGPAVIFPADIPEITAVGGTEFNEGSGNYWSGQMSAGSGSALSYIPEKAWNDTSMGYGIEGTGGGASKVYSKPWWQTGPGVPNDGARDVPDVSMAASAAHDGYLIYYNGSLGVVGGTSAGTPSFAGIVTLLNQYLVAKGIQSKPGLGNINPNLYALAQSSSGIFHDVTVGDNIVPCKTGTTGCTTGTFGYATGAGYDRATGLGSVDAYNFVTNWAALPAAAGTTTTLSANPASIVRTGSTQLTATVKPVSGSTAATGSVTFSLGSTILGTATLVSSGTTGTATLAVAGSNLAVGTNTITAAYVPLGNLAKSTGSATVTVTDSSPVGTSTTLTANPASIATTGSTQLTATVKAASGSSVPAGSVRFSAGATTLGTAPLGASATNSSAVFTLKGSSLTVGSNPVTATYVPSGNFSASTGSATVTVTAPPVATTITATANPTTIATTGTTRITATVKATGSTTASSPLGTVSLMLGSAVIGTANLASGVATLTVAGSSLRIGSNTITANYTASGNFVNSSGTVIVMVTTPPVSTSTTAAASPANIASTGSTTVAATVKAASGASQPTGTVQFASGGKSLGSASVNSGIAALTVQGSFLAVGSNTVTASFTPSGNFTSSSGSTTVTVAAPPAATKITVTASPASLSTTGTTQFTAIVTPLSGSAVPTGSVTFSRGNVLLGSSALSSVNGKATAVLTVKGSSLALGSNTVTASYAGATSFTACTTTQMITVVPVSSSTRK